MISLLKKGLMSFRIDFIFRLFSFFFFNNHYLYKEGSGQLGRVYDEGLRVSSWKKFLGLSLLNHLGNGVLVYEASVTNLVSKLINQNLPFRQTKWRKKENYLRFHDLKLFNKEVLQSPNPKRPIKLAKFEFWPIFLMANFQC